MKNILTKLRELTKRQKIIICSCTAVILVSVSGGIVFSHYQEQKRQAALEAQKIEEEPPVIVIEEPEEEAVQEVVEEVVPEIKNISFTGTSIAKDLKIKIVDEQKKLVSGGSFTITVTAKGANGGKDYNDHDKDGIIYIKNIEAGEYTVQLHDIEGFAIAKNTINVTVKEKIEYKKVDVQNEIKQASEVNIQKEDKPVEKPKEEVKIVNTVELVDSTKKENPVKKEEVDITKLPKATASEKKPNTVYDTTIFSVPESVILYNQEMDDARTYIIEYEISDEKKVIQDITWRMEPKGVFTFSQQEGTQKVLLSAENKGEAKLYVTIKYCVSADEVVNTEQPVNALAEGASVGRSSLPSEDNTLGADDTVSGDDHEGEAGKGDDETGSTIKSKDIYVKVTVSDYADAKEQLKDKNGNNLYLDKDAQQPATSKDYSTTDQFYTTPTYMGWQKIDDSLYYYDENHKAVTGVQVIGGARYHFGEDGKLLKSQEQKGIDVSKWQGTIDWNAVANAGIDFAIIRAGNRGSSTGVLIEDPYFKKNIEGATKAGIKVGVYIYSQAITEAEAIEEASMAISLVSGYKLHLPIYFDTEKIVGGRANSLSVSDRTAITKAFCETIRSAGYMPGIYSNYYWLRDNLNMSQLEMYSVWVAHYADKCGYPGKYDMWQYTSSGSVPGISGRVDLNISYVGY